MKERKHKTTAPGGGKQEKHSSSMKSSLLQIIHTNDLHSMFSGVRNRGGYARVKKVMERLKSRAGQRGIESLVLDGGDFSEGSSFFPVDEGVDTFRALDLLGHDAAVLGNHDHLMGEEVLAYQINESGLRAQVLSSNLVLANHSGSTSAAELVRPYAIFKKGGIKVAVIGFSTPELYFQYPLQKGYILAPSTTAGYYERAAREEGADIVIALTHLGLEEDRRLLRHTGEIDLVVGGHSHTFLEKPQFSPNRKGRPVPMVQAGAHGRAVGSLVLELRQGGRVKVKEYRLHRVDHTVPGEPETEAFVGRAVKRRDTFFESRWSEPVGSSKIDLFGYGSRDYRGLNWVKHQARMVKEAASTELGLHMGSFNGIKVPAGEVTLGDIVDNMPHVRHFGEPGWRLGRFTLEGWRLLAILKALVNFAPEVNFAFYGLSWREFKVPGFIPLLGSRFWILGVRVHQRKLEPRQRYTMGFPAEIAYAVKELLPRSEKYLFPEFKELVLFYWPLAEEYIRRNSPLNKL